MKYTATLNGKQYDVELERIGEYEQSQDMVRQHLHRQLRLQHRQQHLHRRQHLLQ